MFNNTNFNFHHITWCFSHHWTDPDRVSDDFFDTKNLTKRNILLIRLKEFAVYRESRLAKTKLNEYIANLSNDQTDSMTKRDVDKFRLDQFDVFTLIYLESLEKKRLNIDVNRDRCSNETKRMRLEKERRHETKEIELETRQTSNIVMFL